MSDSSCLLTICVPTYNRVVLLCELLEDMIPKIERHSVRLLIIDNCSTDNTREVVESYSDRYDGLSYIRQDSVLDVDDLCEISLKLSNTPYCWVIRDSSRLDKYSLQQIEQVLSEKSPDLYVIGYNHREVGIRPRMYEDRNELLHDLGWLMTRFDSVLFSRRITDVIDFDKSRIPHFFCFNIIFQALAKLETFKVYWSGLEAIGSSVVFPENPRNPRGVFQISGVAWCKSVLALPDVYTMKAKRHCIKALGKKYDLYSGRHLKRQRVVDSLNPDIYRACYDYIRYFAPGNELRFFFYSRYPNRFNKYYRKYRRYYEKTGLPLF